MSWFASLPPQRQIFFRLGLGVLVPWIVFGAMEWADFSFGLRVSFDWSMPWANLLVSFLAVVWAVDVEAWPTPRRLLYAFWVLALHPFWFSFLYDTFRTPPFCDTHGLAVAVVYTPPDPAFSLVNWISLLVLILVCVSFDSTLRRDVEPRALRVMMGAVAGFSAVILVYAALVFPRLKASGDDLFIHFEYFRSSWSWCG